MNEFLDQDDFEPSFPTKSKKSNKTKMIKNDYTPILPSGEDNNHDVFNFESYINDIPITIMGDRIDGVNNDHPFFSKDNFAQNDCNEFDEMKEHPIFGNEMEKNANSDFDLLADLSLMKMNGFNKNDQAHPYFDEEENTGIIENFNQNDKTRVMDEDMNLTNFNQTANTTMMNKTRVTDEDMNLTNFNQTANTTMMNKTRVTDEDMNLTNFNQTANTTMMNKTRVTDEDMNLTKFNQSINKQEMSIVNTSNEESTKRIEEDMEITVRTDGSDTESTGNLTFNLKEGRKFINKRNKRESIGLNLTCIQTNGSDNFLDDTINQSGMGIKATKEEMDISEVDTTEISKLMQNNVTDFTRKINQIVGSEGNQTNQTILQNKTVVGEEDMDFTRINNSNLVSDNEGTGALNFTAAFCSKRKSVGNQTINFDEDMNITKQNNMSFGEETTEPIETGTVDITFNKTKQFNEDMEITENFDNENERNTENFDFFKYDEMFRNCEDNQGSRKSVGFVVPKESRKESINNSPEISESPNEDDLKVKPKAPSDSDSLEPTIRVEEVLQKDKQNNKKKGRFGGLRDSISHLKLEREELLNTSSEDTVSVRNQLRIKPVTLSKNVDTSLETTTPITTRISDPKKRKLEEESEAPKEVPTLKRSESQYLRQLVNNFENSIMENCKEPNSVVRANFNKNGNISLKEFLEEVNIHFIFDQSHEIPNENSLQKKSLNTQQKLNEIFCNVDEYILIQETCKKLQNTNEQLKEENNKLSLLFSEKNPSIVSIFFRSDGKEQLNLKNQLELLRNKCNLEAEISFHSHIRSVMERLLTKKLEENFKNLQSDLSLHQNNSILKKMQLFKQQLEEKEQNLDKEIEMLRNSKNESSSPNQITDLQYKLEEMLSSSAFNLISASSSQLVFTFDNFYKFSVQFCKVKKYSYTIEYMGKSERSQFIHNMLKAHHFKGALEKDYSAQTFQEMVESIQQIEFKCNRFRIFFKEIEALRSKHVLSFNKDFELEVFFENKERTIVFSMLFDLSRTPNYPFGSLPYSFHSYIGQVKEKDLSHIVSKPSYGRLTNLCTSVENLKF